MRLKGRKIYSKKDENVNTKNKKQGVYNESKNVFTFCINGSFTKCGL